MLRLFLAAVALASGVFAFGGTASADFRMTCESSNGRYRFCSVDTFRGVNLERQLSNGPCIKGTTWGYVRSGIWVTLGCRGVFRIETGGGGNNGRDPEPIKDIIADGILRDLADKDNRDGRREPYRRRDALRMCAKVAQDEELRRGARSIFINQARVDVRGQRSYGVYFSFEARYNKGQKNRYYTAKCGVKDGAVQSYDRD
jgi:hypothetical protein